MNIIFFANGKFALNPLDELYKSNHKILAVVTNIDKKSGRKQLLHQTPIATYSESNNLNLIKVNSLDEPDFINRIRNFSADIFIVISYRIMPKILYSLPKFGSINIHTSLLPNYPGASPIQRAIMNNEKTIGLSAFKLNESIDKGDIISQQSYDIDDKIIYGDVHDKLSEISRNFLLKSLDSILNNKKLSKQGIGKYSYAKKINKKEYRLSLDKSSIDVHNHIRALSPPGPHLFFNKKRIKIFNTYYDMKNNISSNIGDYEINNNLLNIQCSNGLLTAKSIQFEGKKVISAIDLRNMNLANNLKFE